MNSYFPKNTMNLGQGDAELHRMFGLLKKEERCRLFEKYGSFSLQGNELSFELLSPLESTVAEWESEFTCRAHSNGRKLELLKDADALMQNRVCILGTSHDFGASIDWYFAPDLDLQWTSHLTRLYWLEPLAWAWKLTGKPEYADKLVATILDFLKKVPPSDERLDFPTNDSWVRHLADQGKDPMRWEGKYKGYSGGPWTSLSAHVRFEWWTRFLSLIWEAPSVTNEAVSVILNSLFGAHLSLMKDFPRQMNQYQGIAVSLVGYGIYYPGFEVASDAEVLGWNRLQKYIGREVYPDGSMAECSFNYSFSCFKRLVASAQISERFNRPDMGWEVRLRNALRYFSLTATPTGMMPRLAKGHGSIFRGLQQIKEVMGDPEVDYLLSGGRYGTMPSQLGMSFPWAGHHVIRSNWTKKATWLFFENGSRGTGHHDLSALSIQLMSGGDWLLVDPGFYTYSTAGESACIADYLHSTEAHCTATIDGVGQIGPKIGENVEPNTCAVMDVVSHSGHVYHVKGTYRDGFGEGGRINVIHNREVTFNVSEMKINVHDHFDSDDEHSISINWQLSPDVSSELKADGVVIKSNNTRMLMRVRAESDYTISLHTGESNPFCGWYSEEYGSLQPATKVKVDLTRVVLPLTVVTEFQLDGFPCS